MTAARIGRARETMAQRDLDALLVTHAQNRRWLTGYTDDDHHPEETGGVLLVTARDATLFVSRNNVDWAAAEAAHVDVQPWRGPWTDSVLEAVQERGIRRFGYEEEALFVGAYHRLREGLPASTSLVPLERSLAALRAIKDDAEMAIIETAIRMTDTALAAALTRLDILMSEAEFAAIVDRALRDAGADGPAFPTIVASGPNAARPHHAPGARQIQPGEPVIIDMGAAWQGYCGDLTRTVCLGEPSSELQSVYTCVLDAQAAALAALRAGMSGKDADAVVRERFAAAGRGGQFVHGLGHGIGLRVHEAPSAGPSATGVLEPGMTLTVEPGLYIPGWGGVRIEDVVVIGESGVRNLTAAPKRLSLV